jgi:hypothetical protein
VDNINSGIIPKLRDNIDITYVSSFLKPHMTLNTQCIRHGFGGMQDRIDSILQLKYAVDIIVTD